MTVRVIHINWFVSLYLLMSFINWAFWIEQVEKLSTLNSLDYLPEKGYYGAHVYVWNWPWGYDAFQVKLTVNHIALERKKESRKNNCFRFSVQTEQIVKQDQRHYYIGLHGSLTPWIGWNIKIYHIFCPVWAEIVFCVN